MKLLRRLSTQAEKTDVLIVGAGPAGLSAAIRLKQNAIKDNKEIRVMVLEKGSEVGSHMLSGNVFEPRALDELIPDWKKEISFTPVSKDKMYFLTKNSSFQLPHPPQLKNKGNYIISLNLFVRYLAEKAESLGVEIYPGFPGSKLIIQNNRLQGVATGDVGIDKNGNKTTNFEQGMQIQANNTLLAEGCHGSLTKQVINEFNLRDSFQTYGIGLKEVWEINEKHENGLVMHTVGYPTDYKTYQGSFIYHWTHENKKLLSIGLVIGLDYKNPYLRPYMEFQRFKHHPKIKPLLENGKCLTYGARALNEGGIQSLPKLTFNGGALIGCAAGFVNVAKIKGTHTAMKSGMIAADMCYLNKLDEYDAELKKSWVYKELYEVRNIRPGFKHGIYVGILNAGFETMFPHKLWTLKHKAKDHESLNKASESLKINYPKPDGVISFDLLENLSRSGTQHNENQPSHLQIQKQNDNLAVFDGPEEKFCPAGVYEYIDGKLQINSPNCIHCKTCDIKDPSQSINWTTPEGGGGPNYILS